MKIFKYSFMGFLMVLVCACTSKPVYFKIVELKEGHPIFCYSYESDRCIDNNVWLQGVTIREFSVDPTTLYKTSAEYNKANKIVWDLSNMNGEKKLPTNKLEYGVVPVGVKELTKALSLKNNFYYRVNDNSYFIKNSFNQYYTSNFFESLPSKASLEDPNFLAKSKGMSIIDCDNHTFGAWVNRSIFTFSKEQLRNPICAG